MEGGGWESGWGWELGAEWVDLSDWVDLSRPQATRSAVVSLGWSEGEGHLRKAVVTERGSWFLANKPWIPSFPLPQAHQLSHFFLYCGGKWRGAAGNEII